MVHNSWHPFDDLNAAQREQLVMFSRLMRAFNRKVNLVSRETIEAFEERHVLHALALAWRAFPPGSVMVDWGTGGGLPAIPLAIRFPDVAVHAVDAVGKKVQAVQAMARRLGLANLHPWHGRAEHWPGRTHYSVSRATAPLATLWRWHRAVCVPLPAAPDPAAWAPGLVCLKGGDLSGEIETLQQAFPSVRVETFSLEPLLDRPFFAGKYIVTVTG
ncbi:class I SAM-dependent methyltransferase [Rhodocaloribacter litoris]|uniref:16S rRNA (guanine(527)-N(7))-methyltransferase RsmG n=1 Tax=Rhodocaloribacter litoris TaxID=2558931 RepID=UPI00141D74AF|nr:RsmG family class I SAM-dependent methyltransferase [Rhodocaloribacter litoris]QXD13723.1 class I SAM-dependent methyltransferase [Rhodocaloribacter litoris]GIV61034.1 MAG: ribosomal RNA small subunit methyltransferase G [Rhodothermaceae bacterium]